MSYETLTKRTIWVAKCDSCDDQKESVTDPPPKERLCIKCNKWIPYVEESYIGSDFK